MAKIKINGDSSGYVEIAAPNAANNNTLELGPGTKILTDSNPLSDIGSIGIGTDAPAAGSKLHLHDTSACRIQLTTDSTGHTSSDGTRLMVDSSNNFEILNRENANIEFFTNNTERLRITSAGRMGVGTNDPAALLEVRDSENSTKGVAQIRISKGVGNGAAPTSVSRADSYLHIGGSEYHTSFGKYNIAFGYTNDEVGSGIPAYIGFVETSLAGYTLGDLVFGTRENTNATGNPAERLRITSTGVINCGHGDAINLHGSTTTGINLNGNGNSGQIVANASDNRALIIGRQGSYGQVIEFFQGTNANEAAITIPAADSFGIETAGTEKLRITSTGKVGVGENTPASQVDIKGNVSSTTQFSGFDGLRIHNANGSAFGVTADMYFTAGTATANRGAAIGVEYESGAGGNDLYFATNQGAVTNNNTLVERLRITSDGDLKTGNINISGYPNTHNIDNYSVFLSDNHANTFFGQNLRLDYSGASGNHQLKVINQHAQIGGAGILIGGNQSSYVNQLKFYTVAANQPAGTRVDDVAARMTIDTSGRVTMPNQPAFHVSGGTALSANTNNVIISSNIDFNRGNHYSNSNGRFTAPVAGVYQLSFWGLLYSHGSGVINIFYTKNGSQFGDLVQGGADSNSHTSRSGTVIMNMSAGDYAELRINPGSSGANAYGSQWNMCGHLIG